MGSNGVRVDPKTHQPLTLRLGIHSDNGDDALIAPYLVEWLAAIGIKLTVQAMSFTQLNTELPKGDWDILMDGWATQYDPSYLLSIESCSTLPANQSTPVTPTRSTATRLTTSQHGHQLTEFSTAQRTQTVDQMQSILYNANVDIILYYPDSLQAVRTNDTNAFYFGKKNAQGFYPQQNVWINWWSATPVGAAGGSSSTGLYIGIAVAVVVVLGGGGFFMMRRRASAGERE